MDHLANDVALVGRHRTPPAARARQLAALIEVGVKQSHGERIFINSDSC
jgi:hypothetical protein